MLRDQLTFLVGTHFHPLCHCCMLYAFRFGICLQLFSDCLNVHCVKCVCVLCSPKWRAEEQKKKKRIEEKGGKTINQTMACENSMVRIGSNCNLHCIGETWPHSLTHTHIHTYTLTQPKHSEPRKHAYDMESHCIAKESFRICSGTAHTHTDGHTFHLSQ